MVQLIDPDARPGRRSDGLPSEPKVPLAEDVLRRLGAVRRRSPSTSETERPDRRR